MAFSIIFGKLKIMAEEMNKRNRQETDSFLKAYAEKYPELCRGTFLEARTQEPKKS